MNYRIRNTFSTRYLGNGKGGMADWRDALKYLQELIEWREDMSAKGVRFSDLEDYAYNEDKKEAQDRVNRLAVPGVIAEFESKVKAYKQSSGKVRHEIAREISRWNVNDLYDAIRLAKEQFQLAIDASPGGLGLGDKLTKLYQEAQDSGDITRQRAAAEVYQSALDSVPHGIDPDARKIANRLRVRAEKDVKALRTTEGLDKAKADQNQAFQDLLDARDELTRVGKAIDADPSDGFHTGPLREQYRRLVSINGEPTVLDADDPRIQPVVWARHDEAQIAE